MVTLAIELKDITWKKLAIVDIKRIFFSKDSIHVTISPPQLIVAKMLSVIWPYSVLGTDEVEYELRGLFATLYYLRILSYW
ncbi:MAG: hypothetical protein Ta2E_01680 [Mycoplasmoidaceae bacterium]|nr:MAG: hypothetical protein Ta2E_01680 [Mycoplasmoidaceae bacterium]